MARKKIRKVHIEDQVWIYVVHRGWYKPYVNIYAPNKTVYDVNASDITGEPEQDMSAFFSDSYSPDLKVTPGKVKEYILTHILKQNENITTD